jgi:hypothetical protein
MGVREKTLQAFRAGRTPGQISRQFGVSLNTTLQYLNQMVGEGKLRRSEILFVIPQEVRQAIADAGGTRPQSVDPDDHRVVRLYGNAKDALGDMYDYLREIESKLHLFIKDHLKCCLGEAETEWWRKGIPDTIRKTCQDRREGDDTESPPEPYSYTDLIDLGSIIEKNWSMFQEFLPNGYRRNRKQLRDDLRRLNGIRRIVMHPVRGAAPTEADFDFVRHFMVALYPTISTELTSVQPVRDVKTKEGRSASRESGND